MNKFQILKDEDTLAHSDEPLYAYYIRMRLLLIQGGYMTLARTRTSEKGNHDGWWSR